MFLCLGHFRYRIRTVDSSLTVKFWIVPEDTHGIRLSSLAVQVLLQPSFIFETWVEVIEQ